MSSLSKTHERSDRGLASDALSELASKWRREAGDLDAASVSEPNRIAAVSYRAAADRIRRMAGELDRAIGRSVVRRTCLTCGRKTCDRVPEDRDPSDCDSWKPDVPASGNPSDPEDVSDCVHEWLEETLYEPNFHVAFAAIRTCRRCGRRQGQDYTAGQTGGPLVDLPDKKN